MKNEKKRRLPDKLNSFTKETRTAKTRFLTALAVNAFTAFTLLIYASFESYLTNMDFLSFTFGNLAGCMLIAALSYVLLMSAFCTLLRGKLFDILLSFLFSFTLCAYIQGNFLNLHLGIMDGTPIEWHKYTLPTLADTLFWFIGLELPFLIYYFSKKLWQTLLTWISAFLLAVQAVSLAVLLLSADFTATSPMASSYLTTEGMFELSEENNVIVFVLDAFDTKYLEEIKNQEESYLEPLSDFTYFSNTTGRQFRTFPSITYLLTQEPFHHDYPVNEYLEKAWDNASFLTQLNDEGYDIRLLTQAEHLGTAAEGLVDNLAQTEREISYSGLFSGMINMIGYRCMPMALKPTFWYYTDDINKQVVKMGSTESAYGTNDPVFYQLLKDGGLTVGEKPGSFRFYHLHGAHRPYDMDAYALPAAGASDYYTQAKGSLYIVYEYLDQMKTLGTYDDATIVLTADHGISDAQTELAYTSNPLIMVKPSGVTDQERMAVSAAPVEQADIQATICASLNLTYAPPQGKNAFDIPEGEDRKRYYLFTTFADGSREDRLIEYEIEGNALELSNWKPTGQEWQSRYSIYPVKR